MSISRSVIRFAACAVAISAGLFSILGSRLSVAAPATTGVTSPVPSAKPSRSHFTPSAAEHDYTITVKLLAGPAGKPMKQLGSGIFTLPAGNIETGIELSASYRVQIQIETDESQEPPEHAVQISVVHFGAKNGVIMAPRMQLTDGSTCMVSGDDHDGNQVQVEVTIAQPDHLQ